MAQPGVEAMLAEVKRPTGRLHLFLGYAPGLGKTGAMLTRAAHLKAQGIDCVAGFPISPCPDSLEQIPPLLVAHRNVSVAELDLHGILRRKPRSVIVDNACHVNPPLFGNRFRYQDIQEILQAGIDVLTSCNIYQIASLGEAIRPLAGSLPRHALPDSFMVQVERIHLSDLDESILWYRLRQEDFFREWHPTSFERALFARQENLSALRLLAMRHAADHLSRQRQNHATPAPLFIPDQTVVGNRILVCTSAHFPASTLLLKHGWHLASRLDRPWFWLHLLTGDAGEISGPEERALREQRVLAGEMGAELVTLESRDEVVTLLDFAHSHEVGHLLLCRPVVDRWWSGSGDLKRLVQEAKGLHLHLFSPQEPPP
ncbi:MAG: hypothetical protein HQL56_06295 [Magnetococcales bacterium]|nr:hypothetical protein [Magnetococcales bacterium]